MTKDRDVFDELAAKWESTIVARKVFDKFSGGAVSPKQLANLDSDGEGPSERIMVGKHVCYPVTAAVAFLRSRSKKLV
ncbi:MAG: hypothetical protein CXZ00_16260 [Acidobacteria bacterium]|nr:MAG: hypothetical protein CXZ00_16260 [Acidobacteriota bacterium]